MTSRSAATGGVHSRPCLASVASQPARGVTQVEWYVCLVHVQEHRRFPSRFTRFSKLLRPPPGSMCRPPYYPGRPGALRPHPFRSQKPTRKARLTLPLARVIFAAGPGQNGDENRSQFCDQFSARGARTTTNALWGRLTTETGHKIATDSRRCFWSHLLAPWPRNGGDMLSRSG